MSDNDTPPRDPGVAAGLLADLLPILSHDVRTPLAAIKGSVGLLASGLVGDLSERHLALLDIGGRNVDLTTLLIQEIVDLLRLNYGLAEFAPTRLDVVAEVNAIRDRLAPATSLGIAVDEPSGGATLVADASYFRHAVEAMVRVPQSYESVEHARLAITAGEGAVTLDLTCGPVEIDADTLGGAIQRGVKRIDGRLHVTGLEASLLSASARAFGGEFAIEQVGDDARLTLRWPDADESAAE